MSDLESALALAVEKHKGQTDLLGEPYILHIIRVLMSVGDDKVVKIIAVLHDIIEDTDVVEDYLRQAGYNERIIAGTMAVNKLEDETYEEYVERVCQNFDAIEVKLADIDDHLALTGFKKLTEGSVKRINKYLKTRRRLKDVLEGKVVIKSNKSMFEELFYFNPYEETLAVELMVGKSAGAKYDKAMAILKHLVDTDDKDKYTLEIDEDSITPVSMFCFADLVHKPKIIKDIEEAHSELFPDEEFIKEDPKKHMKIIGVAVKHKDMVVGLPKPNRHGDIVRHMVDVLGITNIPIGHKCSEPKFCQGFYLEDGTFLNREEAREHALMIKQVETPDHPRELFSEDLW